MTYNASRSAAVVLGLVLTSAATAGMAQTSSYRSATAESGKPARIAVVTPIKADCSIGTLGGVRVITAPKNGTMTLKRGKLKTPATFRCPNVESTVEGVFYESKPNFVGMDEVVFETKSADGQIARSTVQITVSGKAPADAKPAAPKKDGLQEL